MSTNAQTTTKGRGRGFRSMEPERRKEVASLGGKEAHRLKKAHRFTPGPDGTAASAGKVGGTVSKRRPRGSKPNESR